MSFLILLGFVCELLVRINAQLNCASPPATLTGGITLTNVNKTGDIAGTPYAYEAWTDASAEEANYKIILYGNNANPTAAFRAEWDKSKDFLARTGLQMDENKTYLEYPNIKAEYAYTRDPWRNCTFDADGECTDGGVAGDYSYIGVYGWTRKPMVEYYIVDDWFGNRWQSDSTPLGRGTICYDVAILGDGTDPCVVGSFYVDGSVYNVYKHSRTAWNIDGYGPFEQYYSVRADQRKCGTISITEHFKAWESFGLTMQGWLYEAKLLMEAGGGKGWIDYSYATVTADTADVCDPESDDHYTNETGSCTLRSCVERRRNPLIYPPCGTTDCIWDMGNANATKCIAQGTQCSNLDHYALNTATSTCEPKPCANRQKNTAKRLEPCGPGECYWDKGDATGGNNKCIESTTACTNSSNYLKSTETGITNNHTCILKCASRKKTDTDPNEPCGEGDCYWDKGDTSNVKCIDKGTPCTGNYEQKDETRTCEPKPDSDDDSASSITVLKVVLLLLTVILSTFAL